MAGLFKRDKMERWIKEETRFSEVLFTQRLKFTLDISKIIYAFSFKEFWFELATPINDIWRKKLMAKIFIEAEESKVCKMEENSSFQDFPRSLVSNLS